MDFKQIVRLLRAKSAWIVLAVLIGTVASAAYSLYLIDPVYEASAELLATAEVPDGEIDYNSLMASGMLLQTYRDIVETPRLMNEVVVSHPELNLSAAELLGGVATASTGNQIMTIVVRGSSYGQAARTANAVAETLVREIPAILKSNRLILLNPARETEDVGPVKPSHTVNAGIGFVFSLLLSAAWFLLREHLREDFRSAAEVERFTGVTVLGVVPRSKKRCAYPAIRSANEKKAGERLDVAMES
ncbi:YveK family protein [Cohnella caldifontis]|uniref:YveK family protein n=1 Tax=Cohnella caldifontis TaxID=3027471 RepID=UPI0023EE18BF|nr:Wzz/FepE/Etk N-terminal domain-containing protein [Cohnella sp. YIM B05605]